ncbi:MAG: DEAD/DEAH box helicase [Deltaproteobacteria bacterium]|nr:DEAD/DEAH box helicase [Deltaproteobacteria bacterium]
MPKAPWERDRGVEHVVDHWLSRGDVQDCLCAHEILAPREAERAELPSGLHPSLVAALRARGVTSLYSHQRQAIDSAMARKHTVIATPTASGKSLCYHLPVAHALASREHARALYLFPTKALSRDQEASLQSLLSQAGIDRSAVVFDGDTPSDARRAAKARGGVIVSNPDMLHSGILPQHASWASALSSLEYVVIDELHMYKGVFGSHLAHVLRRLQRVARFHGSNPTFICASATIGNPREHAAKLLGLAPEDITLVTESGAPSGQRRVLMYNPPVVNADLGIRQSYLKAAVKLTRDLVRADVSTIVFGPSRTSVEVMLRYVRAALEDDRIAPESIQAYRGGYLPATRRRIEQDLRDGKIKCVVTTNALELGIDIGELDAVVCAGYPGSIAATWQRFGRAGRRQSPSIAVLVTSSNPIDQFLAREPRYLLGRPVEEARIDPDNVEVFVQHLKCAAFELPFRTDEAYADVPMDVTQDALEYLSHNGVLHKSKTRWHWVADQYPAQSVGLRSGGWDNFVVIDLDQNKAIAEVDWRGAHTALFEEAIYQLEADTYQVERLDYEHRKAFVRKIDCDYYTDAAVQVSVSVLDESEHGAMFEGDASLCALGEVQIVQRVTGFKKVKFFSHENLGWGDVHLPEITIQTSAFWLTVCEEHVAALSEVEDGVGRVRGRSAVLDGIRGVAHALEAVTSLALMCDPRDLGYVLGDRSDGTETPRKSGVPGFDPTIFLYDSAPGGVGLSQRAYELRESLLVSARTLIEGCPCTEGCPACVSPTEGLGVLSRKRIALEVMSALGVPVRH